MSNWLKYLLLPIAGALSAFLSFVFASPYAKTLDRPWLSPDDPVSHFTYGTTWATVQHSTFGAMLCGSFCLILELGRRSPKRVLFSTVLGTLLGGIANSLADSGSDYIGIASMRASGAGGQLVGALAWFVLVPASLAFTIAFAMGPTKRRLARAVYSTLVAAVFTFIGKIASSIVAAVSMVATIDPNNLAALKANQMQRSIPIWMTEAIVVGVALGLTTLIADRVSRKGSVRLIYGKNEFRDWSLDHQINRIGSGEVEIPIRGFNGVQPVHACIVNQGSQFMFDSQYAPGAVNGYPVTQVILNHGDAIQIGDATLMFYGSGAVRRNMQPRYIQPQNVFPPMGYPPQGQMAPQGSVAPHPQFQPQANLDPPLAGPVAPLPPQVFLVDIAGVRTMLNIGVTRIGRDQNNEICIPTNNTLSRQHATLTVTADQVIVTDNGSSNGSYVNKAKITSPTPLQANDQVSFGSCTFTIEIQPQNTLS